MTSTTLERPSVSTAVAAEIRAALGRQHVSQRELAERINRQQFWLSRRIGKHASVDMTIDEVAEMAQALGLDAEGLMVAALRACRDSNPKPSDLVFCTGPEGVKRPLTVDRRYRDAWELVA